MKKTLKLKPRLRLLSIYEELGGIPWKKPRKLRKERIRKESGVYMGAREAIIPFLNEDSKRTFSHLLLRPGYMMRDYILRGAHEHYLAPLTALLVFYSVFTLLVAVIKPGQEESMSDSLVRGFRDASAQTDTTDNPYVAKALEAIMKTTADAIALTRLDQFPDEVDTPWKASLAAFEADLRSKGIPVFLGNFLFLWMTMAILLRKKGISVSGAAAASAYVLCQYCIFMLLALLLTWGKTIDLSMLVMGILLLVDYRQLLGITYKASLWLTVKTGLVMLLLQFLLYLLLGISLVGIAFIRLI